MSELHLDLCRQSTKHLSDTIDSLKENLRMLEVFINSGLWDDNKSSLISGSNEEPQINGSIEEDKRVQRSTTPLQLDRHKHCCCMCPAKLGRLCCNPACHGHTTRATSFPSNRSRRPCVSMPRLNRTASLRRETAIERAQSQMTSGRSTR